MKRQKFIDAIRRIYYSFRQPLTIVPNNLDSLVSDLFIWRTGDQLNTFFELINLPSLFSDDFQREFATICIFDKDGNQIATTVFPVLEKSRLSINLANLLPSIPSTSYGTFSVFHQSNIESFVLNKSFLSERGYVSYGSKGDVRSYVHGNFDAISASQNELQMLGGLSFFARSYHVQYLFSPPSTYEIGLVNPSKSKLTFKIELRDSLGNMVFDTKIVIPSRGLHIFVLPKLDKEVRVTIVSRLIMARPLIFRLSESAIDVFHG
jgi:hypothetical protein